MSVNYEYYKIFYYVAKYGSLTKAAAALLSNQPNVSRIIGKLEQELGCRLLVRSSRGVTLTQEGERLYGHVAIAFEHLQLGETELTQNVGLQNGCVSIGATETALHLFLLEALNIFHHTYPGVRLKIYNYSTLEALNALHSGLIDFAAITSPAVIKPPLRETKAGVFQDILVGGKQYASLAGKRLTLSDLKGYPLICMAKSTVTHAFLEEWYLSHGMPLETDIEVASADLMVPLLRNNLGIGFLPGAFALEAIEKGELVKLTLAERLPERYVCLVSDSHRGIPVAARVLQDIALNQCGSLKKQTAREPVPRASDNPV